MKNRFFTLLLIALMFGGMAACGPKEVEEPKEEAEPITSTEDTGGELKVYSSPMDMAQEAMEYVDEIDVPGLKSKIEAGEDITILDIRTQKEWDAGHIENAIHLPRGVLEFKIGKAIKDKNTEIIVYCKTGAKRTPLAVKALKQLGYNNVVSLKGGWLAWTGKEPEAKNEEGGKGGAIVPVPNPQNTSKPVMGGGC